MAKTIFIDANWQRNVEKLLSMTYEYIMVLKVFLILITSSLFNSQLSACTLNSDFNYHVQAPTARELLHRHDLLQDNLDQQIIHSKSGPMITFIDQNHKIEKTTPGAIVHRLPLGPDLYKNVLAAHFVIEKYLENCTEENRDFLLQMHNAKHILKKMGEVRSKLTFIKGKGISDDEVKRFSERFHYIHRQFGLEFTLDASAYEIIIDLNKIEQWSNNRQQYLNFKNSTPKTIHYEFHSTHINGGGYHDYRSFIIFTKMLYTELPLRFKKGLSLGFGKYLFQYLDPYSDYDISIFTRILILCSCILYALVYRKEIRNAWTRKGANSSLPLSDR